MTSAREQKRWIRDTKERTAAKHEQLAAEAQAGAASMLASGITSLRETGAEAEIDLRDGAILSVSAPRMGVIATIRAGDGWATAIISPRVLNGAPGSGGTGDNGDGQSEAWTAGDVREFEPDVMLNMQVLPPGYLAQALRRAFRQLHPDAPQGDIEDMMQEAWEHIRSMP